MKLVKVRLPLIILIIIILLIVFLSVIVVFFLRKSHEVVVGQDLKSGQSEYKYINPLLDCADTEIDSFVYGNIKKKINSLIKNNIANNKVTEVSLYFRDLNNGPWFGYNDEEKFSPASLMKVPLLIAYFKLSETDEDLLNKTINSGSAEEGLSQNIRPAKKIEANKDYTILELLNYMIRYSDNVATQILLKNISQSNLESIYKDLSLKMPNWGNMENYMTVKDYSSFFRILYNASYLNREKSELALNILSESIFTEGLRAGVPEDIVIAHKFGERILIDQKQLHDCGVVYQEKGDYLVCIMTRGNNFKEMGQVIGEISEIIYNNFY
jgi:beta-lactamase class A